MDAINGEHLQMNCKEKPDFPGVDIPNKNTFQKYLLPLNTNSRLPIAFTMMKNEGLLFPEEIKRSVDFFFSKTQSACFYQNGTSPRSPL